MKYALIDTANTFFRARYVAGGSATASEKTGMALHLTLGSINQVVKKFDIDHVVFCLEGRSWRKDVYQPYKANRRLANAALTDEEREEEQLFWQTYESFTAYLKEKTNTTVLRCECAEADDLIARFIHLHPDDEHYIISSDTDFVQLISSNVCQYNGISNQLITLDGYFDENDKPVIDKKTEQPKTVGDPQFVLFEKIMRGDPTDNIFSAYPGVRKKGTKNKIGLIEAYSDRHKKGFNWNNMMLQTWVDHDDNQHVVRDLYERNRQLIDLTCQPDHIKNTIDAAIINDVRTTLAPMIGIHFMRFCGHHELKRISENSAGYMKWLSSAYSGKLAELKDILEKEKINHEEQM